MSNVKHSLPAYNTAAVGEQSKRTDWNECNQSEMPLGVVSVECNRRKSWERACSSASFITDERCFEYARLQRIAN